MGINDKDYADALVYEKQKQAQQQQMEKQMAISPTTSIGGLLGAFGTSQQALGTNGLNPYQQAAQQAALSNNTTSVTMGATGATWATNAAGAVYSGVRPVTEQDLKHDAMLAPLSALIDMWLVRWQGEWVNETEFQEDEFWRLALIRLVGANKLEKHNLANQYHSVYRIIE